MLILSRKVRESIMIGDDIEMTVLKIDGSSRVELGIKAPASIPVHRMEIYKGLRGHNLAAAHIKPDDIHKLFSITPAK